MGQDFYKLACSRRSIRKFEDTPVPDEDIKAFIEAARTAPSGCNSQCWHFVAVTNKELIEKVADATGKAIGKFYQDGKSDEKFITSRVKSTTFFRKAPLVMFVYMDHLDYFDPRVTEFFMRNGYTHRQMMDTIAYPDVLTIGAAVENMMLQMQDMGYGCCWMIDPVIAHKEISELLSVKEENRQLISVIPMGRPKYTPMDKTLKPLEEILEIKK